MKILFVAMHNSVHTARWISQLADQGWDIHLFAVYDYDLPHVDLSNVQVYFVNNPSLPANRMAEAYNLYPLRQGTRLRKLVAKLLPFTENRAYWLARLIKKIKPDVVHSLEMQHAAYLTYEAKAWLKRLPTWIYSCWGSDIYYFQYLPDHMERIKQVLANCDYLFTDCQRDVELAHEYGFTGELLGVFPGVGGFKIDDMLQLTSRVRPSQRRSIVVKGYDGWVYRPFTIIQALALCAAELQGYKIVIYLPGSQELIDFATKTLQAMQVELEIMPYSPHEAMLKLFGEARVSLASSISDGTPNSMLEAMVMGSFPIQSDTVSTAEWIEGGVNGFLAQPEDAVGFANALKRALNDDELVDQAAQHNLEMLRTRIDYPFVQPQVIGAYKKV